MTTENFDNFNALVAALSEATGESLALEEGKVLFAIDEDLGVSIVPVDEADAGLDAAIATIVIGPAPADEEVLAFLLEQNYLGVGSGDGSFAIDHETGALVLYRSFALPFDAATFVDAFGRLAGAARAARARVNGVAEPSDGLCRMMI